MNNKNATIKDVAAVAGLSTATIARVLHNKGYVAEKTRVKVMEAIEQTGYRINSLAQTLKRNRSYVIGHLLQSTEPNPFFIQVARGVEDYARSKGYTTLTYNVQGDKAAEERGVDTFLGWQVDAIIFSNALSESNVKKVINAAIPAVQVERPCCEDTDRIIVDNYQGAMDAMDYLVELGHRTIAFIGQKPGIFGNELSDYVELERFSGYKDTLDILSVFDPSLVYYGAKYSVNFPRESQDGYELMLKCLQQHPNCTSVFAGSDLYAAGILRAIYEVGLKVPEDISVVGFDDTLAQFLSPPLTTVKLPAYQMGMKAAELAIQRHETEGQLENKNIRLDSFFVIRDTVGANKNK